MLGCLPRVFNSRAALLAALLVAVPTPATAFTILVWGDSLSAAHGMPQEQGWAALLADHLAGAGIDVVNRSISGETTVGGLRRLPDTLAEVNPDLLILELGANDGLRGLDLGVARDNLARMVSVSREAGAKVLLLGMRIPPNYGPEYADAFTAMYAELGEAEGVTLLPFFLEPVALDWDMMQPDGIHPTAEAQPVLLDHLWETLVPLLPVEASRATNAALSTAAHASNPSTAAARQ